jgi:hypothetical protein
MSNQVNDPETIARRARFETKYLRKRFPLRSAGAAADKKKSDQNLATPCSTSPQQVCGSSETQEKVGEGPDNAALERFVCSSTLSMKSFYSLILMSIITQASCRRIVTRGCTS